MDYLGIFAFDTASEFKFPINWTILFLYCWLFTKNHQKLPVRAGTAQEQLMGSSTQKATSSFYRQNTPASVSGQNTKALSSRTRKIPKSTQSPSLPVITPLHFTNNSGSIWLFLCTVVVNVGLHEELLKRCPEKVHFFYLTNPCSCMFDTKKAENLKPLQLQQETRLNVLVCYCLSHIQL